MLFFDGLLKHDFNSIIASSADVVLSPDPISVLAFKEKGISSCLFPFGRRQKNCFSSTRTTDKDVAVLFFVSLLKATLPVAASLAERRYLSTRPQHASLIF